MHEAILELHVVECVWLMVLSGFSSHSVTQGVCKLHSAGKGLAWIMILEQEEKEPATEDDKTDRRAATIIQNITQRQHF